MALSESLRKQITDLLTSNRAVLFMKGTPRMPQCGFSAQVVQILDELLPSYETVDVLRSPEIRDGIKEFSQWPTIPQLYVGGEFIGGCDIIREMNASGELQKLIGAEVSEPATPTITISEAATKAFEAALADSGGDPLHLKIDAQFRYELLFGPRDPGDIEVRTSGLTLLLDRSSARRANGMSIDFIDGTGGGLKIDNPNAPPKVRQLSAPELKAMLDRARSLSSTSGPKTSASSPRLRRHARLMRPARNTCLGSTARRPSHSTATLGCAARKPASNCSAKASELSTT